MKRSRGRIEDPYIAGLEAMIANCLEVRERLAPELARLLPPAIRARLLQASKAELRRLPQPQQDLLAAHQANEVTLSILQQWRAEYYARCK